MRVAIIGAGFTGLAAAKRLLEQGHEVEVLERNAHPGGLASAVPFEQTQLEMYYHHIFLSDTEVLTLIRELRLADRLEWLDSRMGFFVDGRLYDFGTPLSLLTFRPLGWLDKLRFGLSVLKLQRLTDAQALEDVTAREWLCRHAGERVYRTCWEPLLKAKFGARHDEIGMAWLWGKIKLRASTRETGRPKEQLGYLRGSFAVLGERLVQRVKALGGVVRTGVAVESVIVEGDRPALRLNGELHAYDRVLLTVPLPVVPALVPDLPPGYVQRLRDIEHTGVVCALLKLKRSFSNTYWMNIGDARIPFGGVIEHTNLVRDPGYGGKCALYLSNYTYTDDPLYQASDEALLDAYMPHLQRINPAFDRGWIEELRVFRTPYAQPVIPTGYAARMPAFETPLPGVFIATMAHIYPEDRGMNYALRTGYRVAEAMGAAGWVERTVPKAEPGAVVAEDR